MARHAAEPADDRGTPCGIYAQALPKDAPKVLHKLANKADLNFSGDLHWTEVAFLVSGIVFQILVGFGLQQWMQNAGWTRTNQSLVLGLLFGLTIALFYRIPFVARSVKRERTHRAIVAWASNGLCPACGYDIALDVTKGDLSPDDDGFAACPQCHAQWKAVRFDAAIETHRKDWHREWEEAQQSRQTESV